MRNLLVLAPLIALTTACAGVPGAIILRDLPRERAVAPALPTTIGPGDLLAVRVWNSEQMTARQRVRADGTIALFFMDSLVVAGRTTAEVAARVAERLDGILVAPRVSVVLEESAASAVTVIGEVRRPGSYPMHRAMPVLEALAMAGGLTELASEDRILLQRGGATPLTVRLRYRELLAGADRAVGLQVGPGDVLIVR